MKSLIMIISLLFSQGLLASNLSDFIGGGSGSSGPTFSGYTTSSYDGSMGGLQGMSNKCDSDYSGSHACTFQEIIQLGTDYTYSSDAWIIDGVGYSYHDGTNGRYFTKDGQSNTTNSIPTCVGWTSNSAGANGPYEATGSGLQFDLCSATKKIPCCQ